MLAKSLVFCSAFLMVTSSQHREGRFFSFNFEDRDIAVDLDFSIPFITIPIKPTVDSFGISQLPTVNINPASLVLGGAVVLGTTILLPIIMKHYASTTYPDYRISRILENTEFSADSVLSFANKMLSDGNGVRGCTLRVACWTAQKQDDSLTRVVNRITSNKILSAFINATSIQDAMLSGRSGRDCGSYVPCPIQEQYIPVLMNNLAALGRSYGVFTETTAVLPKKFEDKNV